MRKTQNSRRHDEMKVRTRQEGYLPCNAFLRIAA